MNVVRSFFKDINLAYLKNDMRKLGVNLISAGTIGLFLTHGIGLSAYAIFIASWVIAIGGCLWLFGLHKVGNKNE